MRILVTGASGFIGRHVVRALSERGHHIVPVARSLGHDMAAMCQPAHWQPLLDGVDAVVNAAGIVLQSGAQTFEAIHHVAPVALFRACAGAGVRKVVQVSALGAGVYAPTAFWRSKAAADAELMQMPLDWWVLQPSLVYGAGGVSHQWLQRMAGWPLLPLVGRGQQYVQPIHVSDVAACVLHALDGAPARQVLPLVGPQAMTLRTWLELLGGERSKAVLSVPVAVAMVGLSAVDMLRPCLGSTLSAHLPPLWQADALRMLLAHSRADVQPLAHWLGRMPVAPTAALITNPDIVEAV